MSWFGKDAARGGESFETSASNLFRSTADSAWRLIDSGANAAVEVADSPYIRARSHTLTPDLGAVEEDDHGLAAGVEALSTEDLAALGKIADEEVAADRDAREAHAGGMLWHVALVGPRVFFFRPSSRGGAVGRRRLQRPQALRRRRSFLRTSRGAPYRRRPPQAASNRGGRCPRSARPTSSGGSSGAATPTSSPGRSTAGRGSSRPAFPNCPVARLPTRPPPR